MNPAIWDPGVSISLTCRDLRQNMPPPHPNICYSASSTIALRHLGMGHWSQPYSSSPSPLAVNRTCSPDSFPCSEHTCICLTWPFPLSQPYLDSSFYIYPSNICPTDLPASSLSLSPVLLPHYKLFSLNHHVVSALCSYVCSNSQTSLG